VRAVDVVPFVELLVDDSTLAAESGNVTTMTSPTVDVEDDFLPSESFAKKPPDDLFLLF
jgi:hypothetical protein